MINQNGDTIKFTNLEGENLEFLTERNWTVKVKSKKVFTLNDFPEGKEFKFINGTSNFVIIPTTVKHQSLSEQIKEPNIHSYYG